MKKINVLFITMLLGITPNILSIAEGYKPISHVVEATPMRKSSATSTFEALNQSRIDAYHESQNYNTPIKPNLIKNIHETSTTATPKLFSQSQVDAYNTSQNKKMNSLFFEKDTPLSSEITDIINTSKPEDLHNNLLKLLNNSKDPQIIQELSNLIPSTQNNPVRDLAWTARESIENKENKNKSLNFQEQKATNKKQSAIDTDINTEQIRVLKDTIRTAKPKSPEVIDIINNATTMDAVNKEFTQLIMTTEKAQISAEIDMIAAQLYGQFRNDNIISELHHLANRRNDSVLPTMNEPRQSLDKKIENLEFSIKIEQDNFKKDSYKQFTQSFKDNVIKLYTDAITKLQEQKSIKQGLQSAYKNMNMESPELQSIIKSKNFNEINKKFIDLLMTTNDSMIPRNIELLVTELGSKFLSDNKITELQLLAHEKNNIQYIVNSENFKNLKGQDKLATLQEDAQKSIPSEREMREKNISQDYKDNVTKLYQSAINKVNIENQQQKNKELKDLHQNTIQEILDNKSLTHQNKVHELNNLRANFQTTDANLSTVSKNLLAMYYDNAITKLNTKSRTEILRHDTNAFIRSSLNSLANLAQQGSLNTRAIASKISGIFKQSGVKNTDGKATRTISVEAAKNAPDKGASQQTITNWINNYITQPINNLITKNREIKVTLTRKQSKQRAEEISKKTPNYDGKIIDLNIIMEDQHPTTDAEGFTTYKGTSGEYQISVIVDKNGIITKSYSEPLISTKPIISKNQPLQAINPAEANYREIAEAASRV